MTNTLSGQLEVDLRNYESFSNDVESGRIIKWAEHEKWTKNAPKMLNEDWLRSQLCRMIAALNKKIRFPLLPPRMNQREKYDREQNTGAANAVLLGNLPDECQKLVNACFSIKAWLPLTIPRRNTTNEPCGMEYDPCNLGPEYIRQFMQVFYDKALFTKKLGCDFFPFENRDHLIHSFLVVLMGQILLSAPVDGRTRALVARALNMSPDSFKTAKTVGTLAEHVYTVRGMAPEGTAPAQWLKRVWPAVALWHDSGYDAATWSLLTWRLFSHSFAVKTALEAPNMAVNVFRKVRTLLDDDLEEEMRNAISRSETVDNGYRHLWFLEECHIQNSNKRPWGRYHALFSAFEFIELLGIRENPNKLAEQKELRHLGAAIANHHEQTLYAGHDADSLKDIAKTFVKSPIGSILAFADLMSGFARTRLKSNKNHGGFDLEIDCDQGPLFIWRPSSGTRFAFCRGIHPSSNPRSVKLRCLWGDFFEADSGGTPKPDCSRQGCTLLDHGGDQ